MNKEKPLKISKKSKNWGSYNYPALKKFVCIYKHFGTGNLKKILKILKIH